jgi:hypothetical protein
MSFPVRLEKNQPADSDNPSAGAAQIRNLKGFLEDLFGVLDTQTYTAKAMDIGVGGQITVGQQRLLFQDGSATVPSFGFSGATGTGLAYDGATTAIAVLRNGTKVGYLGIPAQPDLGGFGLDTSAKSGVPYVQAGTWVLPMGGAWDGVTDDTDAWNLAIAWLNAAPYRALLLPAGQSLITADALDPITQSNFSIIGMGSGATRILVTGSGVGLQVGLTPPITTAQYVYSPKLEGFAVVKTGAGTVTALTLVGCQFGRFGDLTLYTGYTTPTGDIGLDLYGKSENSFSDLWIQADIPIRLSAPTVAAGDGVDQTNFHNLTLYSTRNLQPLILVPAGSAVSNLLFTGNQTWIGGNAGFYLVDATPSGNSGVVVFENVRREDNTVPTTRTSGYSVHVDLGAGASIVKVISRNCRMSAGPDIGYQMNGFKIISNYIHLLIEAYKDGGGTGHAFLDTECVGTSTDSIVLIDVEPGNGTITTTNLSLAMTDGSDSGLKIYSNAGTSAMTDDTPVMTADVGTWTGGTVDTFAYTMVNGLMTVAFRLRGTTVSSTPAFLQLDIPASKVSGKFIDTPIACSDNGVEGFAVAHVNDGGTRIFLSKGSIVYGTWTAGTTAVSGEITFPVS